MKQPERDRWQAKNPPSGFQNRAPLVHDLTNCGDDGPPEDSIDVEDEVRVQG